MTEWFKRWWKAILAGLGLILSGLAIAFTAGKKGTKVSDLEKSIRDIDDEQIKEELKINKEVNKALHKEREELAELNNEVHEQIKQMPKYDPELSDVDNLKNITESKW